MVRRHLNRPLRPPDQVFIASDDWTRGNAKCCRTASSALCAISGRTLADRHESSRRRVPTAGSEASQQEHRRLGSSPGSPANGCSRRRGRQGVGEKLRPVTKTLPTVITACLCRAGYSTPTKPVAVTPLVRSESRIRFGPTVQVSRRPEKWFVLARWKVCSSQ